MEASNTLRDKAVADFRDSLVDDVFAPQDFIPWDEINEEVERSSPGIDLLNRLAKSGQDGIEADALGKAFLEEPKTFSVVQRLLAAPAAGVGFFDGRRLPDNTPRNAEQAEEVAR